VSLRPHRHRAVAPIARAALLGVLVMVLVGCSVDVDGSPGTSVGPGTAAPGAGDIRPAAPAEVVIVLPPADGLAEAERVRVRMLVERAADAGLPGGPAPVLLEPATADALGWTVETAVRRVGASGTVCLIGADGAAALAPVLLLYPAARVCLLPAAGGLDPSPTVPSLTVDVDLDRLGRELGAAARAAAGGGTVLILSARDVMLDRRWLSGVIAGAPGPVGTVASADAALAFLDAQAASLADADADADDDDPPFSLARPPATVVVLDASSEAAALVGPLIDRGVLVVGPRSLLAGLPDAGVVLRWRVRWDVPLAVLLRRVGTGPGSPEGPPGTEPLWDDVVVLEPGPAHVAP
jgi:hypothetical protein